MDSCIFCAIAEHRAPAFILCEDEACVAFLDIHPLARGHTLVIPRAHFPDVFELSDEAGAAVMQMTRKVTKGLREALRPDGLNLLQSNGRPAGQTVFHFHFHIVPRWRDDGLFLPRHALGQADSASLQELAAAVRQNL